IAEAIDTTPHALTGVGSLSRQYLGWAKSPAWAVFDQILIPTIVYSVPGKEAVVVAVSYSQKDEQVVLKVDAKALGFEAGYDVMDAETNEPVKADGGEIPFPLKKHDLRVLRFTAKGETK